jgi:hypothetical protein
MPQEDEHTNKEKIKRDTTALVAIAQKKARKKEKKKEF